LITVLVFDLVALNETSKLKSFIPTDGKNQNAALVVELVAHVLSSPLCKSTRKSATHFA